MQYKAVGKIYHVGETQRVSEKFQKRIVVLELTGKYPQYVPIEFVQDSCSALDACRVGVEAEVEFLLRGREHNGNYYSDLRGESIRPAQTQAPQPAPVVFGDGGSPW